MDMSSSSSTAGMSMTSMTMSSGMSMPTSMTMGMNSSSSMEMMGMDMMAMVFFTSTNTPLYSWAWTPDSTGAYAGTCIFLIVLAALFRGTLLLRSRVWGVLATQKYSVRKLSSGDGPNTTNGHGGSRSWRADFAVKIAAIDTVLAGVGYLLMLAVMTMNLGYFMSVLAGVFVGSVIFSQFTETTMGVSCY